MASASVSSRLLGQIPVVTLLVLCAATALMTDRFLSPVNLNNILVQSSIMAVIAIGMTFVIIGGGFDLSVGSTAALSGCVAAMVMLEAGIGAGVVAGVLVGALVGLVNGLVIAYLRVNPFITTLGTLLVLRGIALALANSQPVNVQDTAWLRFWLNGLPEGWQWLVIPPGGWLMLGLAALAALALRYTVFGRHVFAVGSNEQTARLCGVAVDRVKVWVYILGGVFAAVSGLMLASNQGQGDPTGASGYELDIIAAVVIGGASLSGGVGSVAGSILGTLVMSVIKVGCVLNGIEESTTRIVTGAIIVVAVLVDRLRQQAARD